LPGITDHTGWLRAAVLGATDGVASLLSLAILVSVAARACGAPVTRGAMRVAFQDALAMLATAAVGRLFDIANKLQAGFIVRRMYCGSGCRIS
jgi:VIT1/CCC1 family predicted Fe2+/Mn2+ transporter